MKVQSSRSFQRKVHFEFQKTKKIAAGLKMLRNIRTSNIQIVDTVETVSSISDIYQSNVACSINQPY